MKFGFLFISVLTGLASCMPHDNAKSNESELVTTDWDSTNVVDDQLTAKQILEIKRIHSAFIEVNSHSFEETMTKLSRQENPDREISVWLRMADVYERFTLDKHIEEYDKKYEAYQLILLRATMPEEEVIRQTEFTYLTTDEVKEILGYFVDPDRL